MGKRLVRIKIDDINDNLSLLLQKELDIVLKNDVTLHGKITKVQNQIIYFIDFLRRKHKLNFSKVTEIIIDQESTY